MKMKSRPEKIQQLNLDKLKTPTPTRNKESKLKFKINYLKRTQSKPTLCGVAVRLLHCTRLWYFFSPELVQVESHTLPTLQVLTAE